MCKSDETSKQIEEVGIETLANFLNEKFSRYVEIRQNNNYIRFIINDSRTGYYVFESISFDGNVEHFISDVKRTLENWNDEDWLYNLYVLYEFEGHRPRSPFFSPNMFLPYCQAIFAFVGREISKMYEKGEFPKDNNK